MATAIETGAVAAHLESRAVAVGKAIVAALEYRASVDVERGDDMDDAAWSELSAYLSRRGVSLRNGTASVEVEANSAD
jgi:hypothetical protein